MKMSPGTQLERESSGFYSGEELEDPESDNRSVSDLEIKDHVHTIIKTETPPSPIKRKHENINVKEEDLAKRLCSYDVTQSSARSTSSRTSSSPFRPWSDSRDLSPCSYPLQEEPLALVKKKKDNNESLDFRKDFLNKNKTNMTVSNVNNIFPFYAPMQFVKPIVSDITRRTPSKSPSVETRVGPASEAVLKTLAKSCRIKLENSANELDVSKDLTDKNDVKGRTSTKRQSKIADIPCQRTDSISLKDIRRLANNKISNSSASSTYSKSSLSESIVNYKEKSSQPQNRNYKNMTRERRIEANARERTRVHTISAAFDTLRKTVPSYANNQKLSKLSVLRIACSYIMTLSRIADSDLSADQSAPSVSSCVEAVTKTIQSEGKQKKKDE